LFGVLRGILFLPWHHSHELDVAIIYYFWKTLA
jgi:hypothetical protein